MIPDSQIDAMADRVRRLPQAMRSAPKWRELQGLIERASNARMVGKDDEADRWWVMATQTVDELERAR